jgi:hypothetical protein
MDATGKVDFTRQEKEVPVVRRIVEMFQTPALNQLGAQLIFTTHDTSLPKATSNKCRRLLWIACLAPLEETVGPDGSSTELSDCACKMRG